MPGPLTRKELLRGLFSKVREATGRAIPPRGPAAERMLRPPGSLFPDSAYLTACTGCERCVPACPPGAIFMTEEASPGKRVAVLVAEREPCRLCTGLPCVAACPDGALAGPLDPHRVRIGVAQVDPLRCRTFQGEACDLCLRFCPYPDEAIRAVNGRPLVVPEACTGCGMCEAACPERPRAIRVIPERDLIPGVRLPKIEPRRR